MSSTADIIAGVTAAFAGVPEIAAIALGGSRARGWHHAGSDIDIALYYVGSAARLDHTQLSVIAASLDDAHRPDLASPHGGWGAWMDGGAWLAIDGVSVDLIYRDLDRVDGAIDAALRGEFQIAYHFGHPHGFVSAAYAGEMAICRPLHDPDGLLTSRKARLTPFPEAFRAALIRRFTDESGFTLALLEKAEKRDDTAYAAGLAFRIVACLCQILFALNRVWLINEKGAPERVDRLALHPTAFSRRAASIRHAELAAIARETGALAIGA